MPRAVVAMNRTQRGRRRGRRRGELSCIATHIPPNKCTTSDRSWSRQFQRQQSANQSVRPSVRQSVRRHSDPRAKWYPFVRVSPTDRPTDHCTTTNNSSSALASPRRPFLWPHYSHRRYSSAPVLRVLVRLCLPLSPQQTGRAPHSRRRFRRRLTQSPICIIGPRRPTDRPTDSQTD